MGSVGASNRQVLERMDISKLTESQQKVMQRAYDEVEYARTHTLDEWALKQVLRNYESIEDYPTVKYWDRYSYKSQQDAIDSVMRDVDYKKTRYRKYYDAERDGRALTTTSTNTLRALEKRGFIKIIYDGRDGVDTIKLIEKRK